MRIMRQREATALFVRFLSREIQDSRSQGWVERKAGQQQKKSHREKVYCLYLPHLLLYIKYSIKAAF